MAHPPALAVVVAASSDPIALGRCLASIVPQAQAVEVLVSTNFAEPSVAQLQREFPAVRFLTAPPGTNVFRLRTLGIEATAAPIVVLTEDHCTAQPGWLSTLAAAMHAGHDVVGGPVENGLTRARDWALFLCEYLALLPPLADGPTDALLGVNAAYRRSALGHCAEVWQGEFHESEVHVALGRSGHLQYCASGAQVVSHLQMSLAGAARHLYRCGQRFGQYRQARTAPVRRLLRIGSVPLVPLLLLSRTIRTVARRQPAQLVSLARCLPYLVVLVSAWTAGEARGYVHALRVAPEVLTQESTNAAARHNAG
jgi:hypothetical protein